jgi:hypothetical protein
VSQRRHSHSFGFAIATALSIAVAGCQGATPTTTAGMTLDQGELAETGKPRTAIQVNPMGGGDTYFTLSLPPEPPLPKNITKVSGTAGNFSSQLKDEKTPVVTNVIPNTNGFIIEGANLNKTTISYILAGTPLTVTKRTANQVVATIAPTGKKSGVLDIRDSGVVLVRASADANNVYVNGRVVAEFVEGAPRAAVESALQKAGIKYYRFPGMNYVVAYHDMALAFDTVASKLAATGVFTGVTRDALFRQQAVTVSDPRVSEQWALNMINASAGWTYSVGSPDSIVAVLDTGIQTNHPDLAQNIYVNPGEKGGNGIDDDGNGRVDDVNGWNSYDQTANVQDDNGHGTQMAGIISAVANTTGIVGLAFSSRVIPVKVLNSSGVGTSSSIIDGINYAVRNRASVINISVTSVMDDPAVKGAIEFASTFNVTTVAPMGNDSARLTRYPAAWSRELPVVAVGATNSSDARPAYSNWGDWNTVTAPGEGILTTTVGNGYATITGTSAAAAYVSGLAAMIKAVKPGYTPALVKDTISQSVVDKGTPGYDEYFGYGRINCALALDNLLGSLTVETSSEHFTGNYPADRALDKNTETYWSSARRTADNPEWMVVDLGGPRTVSSIAALSPPYYPFLFPADFTIETSKDGTNWTTVASEVDFQIDECTWRKWNISPVTAQYVRFNITKSRVNPDNGLYYDMIGEVAINGEENAIVKSSSSNYYGVFYPTKNLVDKDPSTMWISANRKTMKPEFAIADLGSAKSISSVDLLSPPRIISEAFPKSFSLFVSNDKVNWTWVKDAKDIVAAPSQWYHFPITPVPARYVRVEVSETNFAKGNGTLFGGYELSGYTAAIAEVEVNRP